MSDCANSLSQFYIHFADERHHKHLFKNQILEYTANYIFKLHVLYMNRADTLSP